jgi:hypothetical protein
MSAINQALTAIRRGFHAFFKADVRLQRQDGQMLIVLDDARAAAARPARPARGGKLDEAARKDSRELKEMTAALSALLDELPENRTTLRHLVFIEHALQKKGSRALYKVPMEVLKRAHEQLEAVVTNWSSTGLACLRSKMAVAVIDREVRDSPAEAEEDVYRTAAVLDAPLAHPEPVDEATEREVEEALLAAYANLSGPDTRESPLDALPPLPAGGPAHPSPDVDATGPALTLQGELHSPSAKALNKAAKAGPQGTPVELEIREVRA